MKSLLLFLACIAGLQLQIGCSSSRPPNLPPNVVKGTLLVDNLNRDYLLYRPKNSDLKAKLPLLLLLHGRLETGETMMRGSNFNTIAEREGCIVAYPYGYKKSWGDGRGVVPADKEGINDVKFISTLVDTLIAIENIDSNHIFVAGYSNGAIMANRLSVELTERLAGMASVEGDATYADLRRFPLKKNLPVLFINGTADHIVKYEGGTGGLFGNYSFPPVEQVLSIWRKFNGCSEEATIQKYDEKDDGTVSIIFRYDCTKAPVVQILDINAGHIWPEYKVNYPEAILGKKTTEINASEEIWKFFREVMGGDG